MRIWIRLFKETHMTKDYLAENNSAETRTHKVINALEEACKSFDLEVPIWLESNIKDFKRNGKTRFTKDCFIEDVEFDYMEFQVIEED